MRKLEYVLSGCGHMGTHTNFFHEDEEMTKALAARITATQNIVKSNLRAYCKNTDPMISVLFNAFTNDMTPTKLKALNNIGGDAVYADSGGLQMITRGKNAGDASIKAGIYKNQSYSDFAMCFDEIALMSIDDSGGRQERTNVGNKIFLQDKHKAAGKKTGENVKEQIAYFREHNAKTKVIAIVQGNNAQDMVDFFNEMTSVFSDDDYDYIGGMAVADTCMGNKPLETIEMCQAAHEITRNSHEAFKKHLHILGVGSISRMRPFLYLLKSGYIDTFDRVSYDSSSHTASWNMGKVIMQGVTIGLGKYKSPAAVDYFQKIYDYFEPLLKPHVTFDEYLDIVFSKESGIWTMSDIKKRIEGQSVEKRLIVATTPLMYVLYMIEDMMKGVDDVFDKTDEDTTVLSTLLEVKTTDDMRVWSKNFSHMIDSNRIKRQSNIVSLENFFA